MIEGKRLQGLPVEDTVRVFVRTADDVMGTVDLSWTIHKDQPSYISVYGSQGTLQVGWKESKYRRNDQTAWTVFGRGYDKLQAFTSQIDNLAHTLRGEGELLIKPDDALASVEVIEAAYESLWHNRWQPVDQTHRDWDSARTARRSIAGIAP